MKLVTAGGLRIDYLITHEGQAYLGLVGGNALYAAVGAALWHDDVALWARLGQNYPVQWLAQLSQLGLKIEGLVQTPVWQDHRTFYAYTSGGRVDTDPALHFNRIGLPLPEPLLDYVHSTPGQDEPHQYEPLALRPEDWPAAYAGATAVHLAPLALSTHLHVPAALRRKGVKCITLDPGERYMTPARLPFIRQLLPHLDVFLPSDQEIRSLFGPGVELWQAAETLCQWGAPVVVIKNGAEGVLVASGGERVRLPAYHQPGDSRVVDVTGAGDAFCGGFLVGLAQTGDGLAAARLGLVSASLVIEGYGALYALEQGRHEAHQRLRQLSGFSDGRSRFSALHQDGAVGDESSDQAHGRIDRQQGDAGHA